MCTFEKPIPESAEAEEFRSDLDGLLLTPAREIEFLQAKGFQRPVHWSANEQGMVWLGVGCG